MPEASGLVKVDFAVLDSATMNDVKPPGEPTAGHLRGDGPTRRLELPILDAVPGLAHAFTVRGADPHAALREAARRDLPLLSLRQVHGSTVRIVTGPSQADATTGGPAGGADPEPGDALATRSTGVGLGVFVADCLPILACDPDTGALAAVHAGWRGTVRGVLREALETLRRDLGARMQEVRIGIGPGIGTCCFEVGDEVVAALLRFDPGAGGCIVRDGRLRVDLVGANRRQAIAAGVREDRIQAAGWCTFCSPDLASFRRDRDSAGRMAGLIAWRS